MVQLSATMEQNREMQLAQLYDVLGFRRVIARYDVLSTLHETGPRAALPQFRVETLIGSQANYEIKIKITIRFYKIMISYEKYSTLNLY